MFVFVEEALTMFSIRAKKSSFCGIYSQIHIHKLIFPSVLSQLNDVIEVLYLLRKTCFNGR